MFFTVRSGYRRTTNNSRDRATTAAQHPGTTFTLLVLLFTSLLAIPLACQCFLHTLTLARFEVKGMTLYLFDNVFLLYLALEPAQCVF